MNKTIIININSIVFHIEEEAYEVLRSYMIDIKKHFAKTQDSEEILMDIENRIAEMFSEKIQQGKKEVISLEDVHHVIEQMGTVNDFDIEAEETTSQEHRYDSQASAAFHKKLMRNPDDKILGGVCSGLGAYFGLEAKWVRIIFLCFFFFAGTGFMLYAVLWVVMPLAVTRADKLAMKGEMPNLQNFKKSFEEELQSLDPHLSKAKSEIAKGTSFCGNFICKLGKLFAQVIGIAVLIFCAMTILGLLIGCVGFITGVLGYQNEMVFPGTEALPTYQAILALVAGTLAIAIPFAALLHIMLRLLFKTKPMNTYVSLGLWATWITSVIAVVFFSLMGAQEYKESSTIKVEKELEPQQLYRFSEKDVRLIEATEDKDDRNFKIEINGESLANVLHDDIDIRFMSVDSLAKPYIQYNYSARGRNFRLATRNASEIEYLAKQDNENIVFNSHFALKHNNKYRDQEVSVFVYLPLGSKVIIDKSLNSKIRSLSIWDCRNEYEEDDIKKTEWIMGPNGLRCTPNFQSNN